MQNKYDIVIVGCGTAGLYAALQFDESISVLVLCKRDRTVSNSSLAQGGVAAVLNFEDDSFELHVQDTMIAGGQKNNLSAVETLVSEGPDDVRRIMNMGFDYDRDENGKPQKTLEGGHSRRRIVHHKDTTGSDIVRTLLEQVKNHKNVEIAENTMAISIERDLNGFRLDLLVDDDDKSPDSNATGTFKSIFADFCLLATGGIGRVYKYTTNPVVATGDGIRLAYEMGARIKNISYVQFHPTAFNAEGRGEQFLISEAVRGEGAYLLNCNEERFMHKYDERFELAPRDVVSRSIILESRRTGSNKFYLDIRFKGEAFIKNRFPGISKGCMEYGVDITKDLIPIFPCQHYLMGGIETDLNGETTVPRLFAAGECAHTGVHGSNRLASNSLLEALVFGRRAASEIQSQMRRGIQKITPYEYKKVCEGAPVPDDIAEEIRTIMQRAYFVLPDEDEVRKGHIRVSEIVKRLRTSGFALTQDYCETLSLATVAYLILREVDEE